MGPSLKLPMYVQAFVDRHGRPRYYFRRRGFARVPLRGLPWSPDFMAAYKAALDAGRVPLGIGNDPGTVDAVVTAYLNSETFGDLAAATRAMRRALLLRFCKAHGEKPLAAMEGRHVAQLLDRLRPYPQRNMLKALRGLMAFAYVERAIDVDPTAGYKPRRVKDTGGSRTWTEEDVAAFEARHPIGSNARLALALLLYTGQRRGDIVRVGRQHIRGGVLSLRQSKTGAPIDIPVLADLQTVLDVAPVGMTFLITERGKPFTAAGFGGWFRRRCNEAGLYGLSAHGLRKAAATRLADHGATAHELMAWFGWTTLREAERYTRAANRKALAQGVAQKLKGRT
jgi:integrase